MTYRSIHLRFPANAPYDQENWFETFVGRFVMPLLGTGLVDQYWFTRYGDTRTREIRLRITTNNIGMLEPMIHKQIVAERFVDLADEANATLVNNLGGGRFLSPDARNQSADHRGQLMLNLHHALAVLFVESLIGPDSEGRFRQEKNADANNPHGSIFETVHHLVCNTTEVTTEVEMMRIGDNQIIVESPLYASQIKVQAQAQGIPLVPLGTLRVHF